MAEYKKKAVKKKLHTTKEQKPANIVMKNSKTKSVNTKDSPQLKNNFKVFKREKQDKKLTGLVFIASVIIVLSIYLIILAFHPIGVLEYFSSVYKTVGTGGGYDVSLTGDNIVSVETHDNYYYILNTSELICLNNNGKTISKINHGFSKPILKISETRSMVYGQGEKFVKVFKFDEEAINLQFDFSILSADIAENGTFAVSTYSDSYESVVYVYNKKGEPIFEWYCADGTVSSVLLNKNGNKIAISSFSVSNGMINTKIRILNFKSATPEQTFSFENDMIYGMYNLSNNKLCAVFENSFYTLDVKNGSYINNQTEYSYNFVEPYKNKLVLSSSLSANSEKNTVEIIGNKAQIIGKFTLDASIKDLTVTGNCICFLTEKSIIITDFSGNIISETEISFDNKRIISISADTLVTVSNGKASKIEIKEGKIK